MMCSGSIKLHYMFVASLPAEETISRIMDMKLDIEGESLMSHPSHCLLHNCLCCVCEQRLAVCVSRLLFVLWN